MDSNICLNEYCLSLPYFIIMMVIIVFLIVKYSNLYKKPEIISKNGDKEIKLIIGALQF